MLELLCWIGLSVVSLSLLISQYRNLKMTIGVALGNLCGWWMIVATFIVVKIIQWTGTP